MKPVYRATLTIGGEDVVHGTAHRDRLPKTLTFTSKPDPPHARRAAAWHESARRSRARAVSDGSRKSSPQIFLAQTQHFALFRVSAND
ncbi:hypothetical protein PT2222_100191 [Paraburkholderia tropica]